MALDTMERTEEERCSVVWLIGLSRSSLSRDAKLRAFRNLKTDEQRTCMSSFLLSMPYFAKMWQTLLSCFKE